MIINDRFVIEATNIEDLLDYLEEKAPNELVKDIREIKKHIYSILTLVDTQYSLLKEVLKNERES